MNRSISMMRAAAASSLFFVVFLIATAPVGAAEKHDFAVAGEYVEGCSCAATCPCETSGVRMGCLGVGAMKLSGGTYNGMDLTGGKIAYATKPGSWIRLYVESPSKEQLKGLIAFARAAYADWGKMESVKEAKIAFDGADGKYTVKVTGGSIMQLSTTPVIGGDGKTAVTISNVKDPFNSTFSQGKTVSGTYKDGARSFTLKGTNSFFNIAMSSSGKI